MYVCNQRGYSSSSALKLEDSMHTAGVEGSSETERLPSVGWGLETTSESLGNPCGQVH